MRICGQMEFSQNAKKVDRGINSHRAGIRMIHRERETRQERDHDTTFPRRAIPVSPNNAVNQGISDSVFHFDVHRDGANGCYTEHDNENEIDSDQPRNEELILNVNKMFRHLNGCKDVNG